jgi:hypothetical protein
MKNLATLLLGTVLAAAPAARAADAWVIDAIVFAPAGADGSNLWQAGEVLPPCNSLRLRDGGAVPAFTDADPCQPADGAATPRAGGVAGMSPALESEANRLRASGYRVLWNGSWRQTAPAAAPQPVFIDGNDAGIGRLAGTLVVAGTAKVPEMRLDLVLQPPAKLLPDGTPAPVGYARLQQVRRMKSGELQYVDHPLLGAVFRITAPPEPANGP